MELTDKVEAALKEIAKLAPEEQPNKISLTLIDIIERDDEIDSEQMRALLFGVTVCVWARQLGISDAAILSGAQGLHSAGKNITWTLKP